MRRKVSGARINWLSTSARLAANEESMQNALLRTGKGDVDKVISAQKRAQKASEKYKNARSNELFRRLKENGRAKRGN